METNLTRILSTGNRWFVELTFMCILGWDVSCLQAGLWHPVILTVLWEQTQGLIFEMRLTSWRKNSKYKTFLKNMDKKVTKVGLRVRKVVAKAGTFYGQRKEESLFLWRLGNFLLRRILRIRWGSCLWWFGWGHVRCRRMNYVAVENDLVILFAKWEIEIQPGF